MIKLFEENSYIKEFDTEIINLDEENKLIELEKTAFYGKGGGQPGDSGELITELETIEVIETIKKEGSLQHQVNSVNNLKIGNLK